LRHFSSVEIAGTEIELSHSVSSQGVAFYFVVAISLVFGENNPSSFRDKRKPSLIRGSTPKVVSVASILNAVGL
jgi:hypothetical protein